jgi:hypothetical protein
MGRSTSVALPGGRRRRVVGVVIPKHSANPWERIWENLVQWGDCLGGKNHIDRFGQPSEGPGDQFGALMTGEYPETYYTTIEERD